MQKKITLELELETEWESAVHAQLGDLLSEIEDSNFKVKNVKVEDAPRLTLASTPPKIATTTRNGRMAWYDDYDGQ